MVLRLQLVALFACLCHQGICAEPPSKRILDDDKVEDEDDDPVGSLAKPCDGSCGQPIDETVLLQLDNTVASGRDRQKMEFEVTADPKSTRQCQKIRGHEDHKTVLKKGTCRFARMSMQQLDTDLVVEEGDKVRETGVWLFPSPTVKIKPDIFDADHSKEDCTELRENNNFDKPDTTDEHVSTAIGCHGLLDGTKNKYEALGQVICPKKSADFAKVNINRLKKWDLFLNDGELVSAHTKKSLKQILSATENPGKQVFLNVKQISQDKEKITAVDLRHANTGDTHVLEVVIHSWPEVYTAQQDWFFEIELEANKNPGAVFHTGDASVRGFTTFIIPEKHQGQCFVSMLNGVYDLTKKSNDGALITSVLHVFPSDSVIQALDVCSVEKQVAGKVMPDLTERFFQNDPWSLEAQLAPWKLGGARSHHDSTISSSGIGYESVFVIGKNSEGNFDRSETAVFDFAPEVFHEGPLITYDHLYTASALSGKESSFTRASFPIVKEAKDFARVFEDVSKLFDTSVLHKRKNVFMRLDLGNTAYLLSVGTENGEPFYLTLADVLIHFFGDATLCP